MTSGALAVILHGMDTYLTFSLEVDGRFVGNTTVLCNGTLEAARSLAEAGARDYWGSTSEIGLRLLREVQA